MRWPTVFDLTQRTIVADEAAMNAATLAVIDAHFTHGVCNVVQPGAPTLVRSAAAHLAVVGECVLSLDGRSDLRPPRRVLYRIAELADIPNASQRSTIPVLRDLVVSALSQQRVLIIVEYADSGQIEARALLRQMYDQMPLLGLVFCTQASTSESVLTWDMGSRLRSVVHAGPSSDDADT